MPLTFRIHFVYAAYDLLSRTGERDELPEWYLDEEWTRRYGFPTDYPDADRFGYLRCRPVTELRGPIYVRTGFDCDLYLPYAYGRREVRSKNGLGVFRDSTPLLVLEDTIDYHDSPQNLPGVEFHIERVGWIGDTKGTVIAGTWCDVPDCTIANVFHVVALPGLTTLPPGVTEKTLYAANRVAVAVQNGEMTKAEAERSLLDVVVDLRSDAVIWIVRNMPVYDQTDGTWSSFETYAIELGHDSGVPPNSRLATDPVGTAVDMAFGDATVDEMINWMGLSRP